MFLTPCLSSFELFRSLKFKSMTFFRGVFCHDDKHEMYKRPSFLYFASQKSMFFFSPVFNLLSCLRV